MSKEHKKLDKIYQESKEKSNSLEDKDSKKKKVQVWIKEETIAYEEELMQLQIELLKLQGHIKKTGDKVLVIFEGRDAAGKGGTIKRLTEHLNPRGCRVVALEKPSEVEKTQWYFQRYITHLPSAGEIVIFDRSWYNRAMVEPVMGFCTQEEHKRFLADVANFEEMLVKTGGIKLIKFYFSVSKKEQERRFKSRETDPLKHFKLSSVDKESQKLWDKYTLAKLQMLMASNRTLTPWTIIRSDNKKRARIGAIKHFLQAQEYKGKDKAQIDLRPSPEIVVDGIKEIELMEGAKDFSEMAG
ncbi:MAG: polyphosphate kinase 2 [Campylobacterales bacterium]|nr:polyphosphate kinase 2 [Campylobacterales bacterium]